MELSDHHAIVVDTGRDAFDYGHAAGGDEPGQGADVLPLHSKPPPKLEASLVCLPLPPATGLARSTGEFSLPVPFDSPWELVAPLMPDSTGKAERSFNDHLLMPEGIIYRCRAGILSRDLPDSATEPGTPSWVPC